MLPIGSLVLDVGSFMAANPGLVNHIAGHALAHTLYSYMRRGSRRAGLSLRQRRKISNRNRRRFVDNIIMHHKRLHDRNREIVISNARSRALARRNANKKQEITNSLQRSKEMKRDDGAMKWRNAINLKERGAALRGRTDARRLRARSRWMSVQKIKE